MRFHFSSHFFFIHSCWLAAVASTSSSTVYTFYAIRVLNFHHQTKTSRGSYDSLRVRGCRMCKYQFLRCGNDTISINSPDPNRTTASIPNPKTTRILSNSFAFGDSFFSWRVFVQTIEFCCCSKNMKLEAKRKHDCAGLIFIVCLYSLQCSASNTTTEKPYTFPTKSFSFEMLFLLLLFPVCSSRSPSLLLLLLLLLSPSSF